MSRSVRELGVIYTSDIHSHFDRMPRIAALVKHLRTRYHADSVLVMDGGDHMDRMRMETEGTDGLANIEVMNATGYDMAVPGNNEGLTLMPETIATLYGKHAEFDVLGANMTESGTGRLPEWMRPWQIVRRNGLRIGVIGVTVDFNTFYERIGWHIRDPLETAGKWVSELRPRVDLLFVVSHLGLDRDRRMAREIEGIDCIFGGHTHHLLDPPLLENGTWIFAVGKFGEYVGEMRFRYDTDAGQLTSVEGFCHPVANMGESPDVVRIIEHSRGVSESVLSREVARLQESLFTDWRHESPLGNLLAEGIRKWTRSEIGIVNAGQILTPLDRGAVTRKHLLLACPSPINPCRMELSGAHILRALEESLLPEFVNLPLRGFGFRGKVLGKLCLSGIKVTHDPSRAAYDKIVAAEVNGRPLEANRSYVVGTIDMFTFGIGYTSLKEGQNIRFFLPEFIRDVLRAELQNPAAILKCRELKWLSGS